MDDANARMLKSLLHRQPVAALATLHSGEPAVSMVPFALLPGSADIAIHVSRLAAHTHDMLAMPAVALLVAGSPDDATTPLALPRVSLRGKARLLDRESAEYAVARAAYLAKLPDAEELFAFADFSLFAIAPETARLVAGFGRAVSLDAARLRSILSA